MYRFKTTIEKQIQAAAVLAHLEGGRIERIRLLKLLYIADREMLADRACPIVGGRVVAMNNGPLHSKVYDLVKGSDFDFEQWARHFDNQGHMVVLHDEPGRLMLSAVEIEKLTAVSNARRDVDTWEIVEETHGFQEWQDCQKRDSSATIPAEMILANVGFAKDEISEILSSAESHRRMSKILSR